MQSELKRISTGIEGLDQILNGGLLANRAYLLRGGPGTGKSTLGLQFLSMGAQEGENVLYITMEESEKQLRLTAEQKKIDLQKVEFLDLSPSAEFFIEVESYDIFSPAEVEKQPLTQKIMEKVEAIKPQRVFIDSLTQFRYLATDVFQFHRQVLSFLKFLLERGATVLFTSENSPAAPDEDLQFLSDGIIHLKNKGDLRTVEILKFRGSDFRQGEHELKLTDEGMLVFPKLLPEKELRVFDTEVLSSGIKELDAMLNGGLEMSTITLLSGPSGVGKTNLGLSFLKQAALKGKKSLFLVFEEELDVLLYRAERIGIPLKNMVERDIIKIINVEPLLWTPDAFANMVIDVVKKHQIKVVMLDCVNTFQLTLHGENLIEHLHALCKYLQRIGIHVILTSETSSILGGVNITEFSLSYLADNVIFLRYLEIKGQLRKAIGVLKKRMSDFEKTLREFQITSEGIKVGEPLTQLRGILSGEPEWQEENNG